MTWISHRDEIRGRTVLYGRLANATLRVEPDEESMASFSFDRITGIQCAATGEGREGGPFVCVISRLTIR